MLLLSNASQCIIFAAMICLSVLHIKYTHKIYKYEYNPIINAIHIISANVFVMSEARLDKGYRTMQNKQLIELSN